MLQGVSAKAKDAYASACAARDQAGQRTGGRVRRGRTSPTSPPPSTAAATASWGAAPPPASASPADSMGVAMRTMPLGTVVEITYGDATVRATVNDRGPYSGNRQIDLQPAVAEALGLQRHRHRWVPGGGIGPSPTTATGRMVFSWGMGGSFRPATTLLQAVPADDELNTGEAWPFRETRSI
jgi:hypothetical protein